LYVSLTTFGGDELQQGNLAGALNMANPGNGGAIHVSGLTTHVVVADSMFENNRAAREGGALWNQTSSTMIVNSSLLENNLAEGNDSDDGGGAIFNNGGVLTVRNSQLLNNRASGSAAGGGGIFNGGGDLIIETSEIRGNLADGTTGSGGGVLTSDLGGTLKVTDSQIVGNVAERAGGGIEVGVAAVLLVNVDLDGNEALGTAGAVAGAPGNGGGLHVTGSAVITIRGGTIKDNMAAAEGGGLWNSATGVMAVLQGAAVNGNIAKGALADDGGGGLFNNGGTLRVFDSAVTNNIANGAMGSGGGIFSIAGNTIIVRSEIAGNVAHRAGGGVEVVDGYVLLLDSTLGGDDDSKVNIAGPDGFASPGNGGGIHVSGNLGTRVVVENSNVVNNQAAREGGGLWNQSGSTLIVRGGSHISTNVASGTEADDGGGGIFNNGGTVHVKNSTISGNLANGREGSGGGIFSTDGNVSFTSSTISANVANRAGGGIEVVEGQVYLSGSMLGGLAPADGNIAGPAGQDTPGNGGGLHMTGAARAIINSTLVGNNTAAREGGGLWNPNNGAIYASLSEFIDNSALSDTSTAGGGGIFNNGGTLGVFECTFSQNNTLGSGGALFLKQASGTFIRDTVFSDNSAKIRGGAILNSGITDVVRGEITGNTAGVNGGGAFASAVGDIDFIDTFFADNDPNDIWPI
jgi:hypothetical protein